MPKSDKREYRSMPVVALKRAEGEEENYRVRGYASTFGEAYPIFEDWDGNKYLEVIDAHAFDEADMTDVILQYDHEGMVYARTKNGSLKLDVDDHGLLVEADLGLTEESRKLYDAIRTGLVDQMSFCFTVAEDKFNKDSRTTTILKVRKVYDVSAVSIPANAGTEISAERKKRMDGLIQDERAERLAEEARQNKIRILQLRLRIAKGD